jgi:hypothetical protein
MPCRGVAFCREAITVGTRIAYNLLRSLLSRSLTLWHAKEPNYFPLAFYFAQANSAWAAQATGIHSGGAALG